MASASSEKDDFASVDPDQKEVLDEEPRSILRGLISQLAKGTDLHRITLPTFVLEPRSMLERITDFMSHPELILSSALKDDPVDRFVDVVRYFISGWHIRPRGVKKPYNPVLGEFFRCRYAYADGSKGFYVAEQTSHHPPISSYYFDSPANFLAIHGELKPKSKFLVNSAATLMTGETRLKFTNRAEEYVLTLPNVYVRGILFGTMVLELGDGVTIACVATGLSCDVEFKTKGYFSGSYNTIAGKIRRGPKKEPIYELSGTWSDISFIKPTKSASTPTLLSPATPLATDAAMAGPASPTSPPATMATSPLCNKSLVATMVNSPGAAIELFNARTSRIHPKIVTEENDQEENESRRQWRKVTSAILRKDLDAATEDKTRIEDAQRNTRREISERGEIFKPRFFTPLVSDPESFVFKIEYTLPQDPKERSKLLEQFIFLKLVEEQVAGDADEKNSSLVDSRSAAAVAATRSDERIGSNGSSCSHRGECGSNNSDNNNNTTTSPSSSLTQITGSKGN